MNIFYWNKLLVAIEAMKYGKPVIASNRGALPEIIGNRVGGVFEFNNIIEQYKKRLCWRIYFRVSPLPLFLISDAKIQRIFELCKFFGNYFQAFKLI